MDEVTAALNGKTAINRVYHILRTKIVKCELAPGEKLKIESLKELLEIGASPIREALSLLTSDGLVHRLDQRGFRVAPMSMDNFKEILMLRCQLDALALTKSIELGDEQWEERLVVAQHRLSRADSNNFEQWEDLHKRFHMSLLDQCNSPILYNYCNQLYDQNIRYRFLAEKAVTFKSRNVSNEHSDILDAALDRDAPRASETLISHYNRTGNSLATLIEKQVDFFD